MTRIICVGNRFYYPDDFGIKIYEELKKLDLKDVEVVEGGVGGDSLSLYFDDEAKIIIVDFAPNMPKILTKQDILKLDINTYEHSNSLMYFLKEVQKNYTIYTCSKKYDKNNLQIYIDEILELCYDN